MEAPALEEGSMTEEEIDADWADDDADDGTWDGTYDDDSIALDDDDESFNFYDVDVNMFGCYVYTGTNLNLVCK